jgi:hypothetical protein
MSTHSSFGSDWLKMVTLHEGLHEFLRVTTARGIPTRGILAF